MFYSLVIPVFNRPDHIQKLLQCLTRQSFKNFEVIVVESGSTVKSDEVVSHFQGQLNIRYIYKSNEGQGVSRNRGMQEATGDYLIILDSDILLPDHYIETIENHLQKDYLDAFGGPDKLHPESSTFQKAVNFCMTDPLTTGGTRGHNKSIGQYYPRSFNMGVSRKVYEDTGGFSIPFMGEDIEWSARILDKGYKTGLIPGAYVHHERKNSLKGFFKQLFFFGRARINISKLVPGSFKITHLLPLLYCLYVLSLPLICFLLPAWFFIIFLPFLIYNVMILLKAGIQYKSLRIGFFSFILTNTLMLAYSMGMIREFNKLYIQQKEQTYIP